MKTNCFNQLVLDSSCRLAMPIMVYPGLAITGQRVSGAISNSGYQFGAIDTLQKRYQMPWILSAMDLSAEAEAFGCALSQLSDNEIPSVTGRLITSLGEAQNLAVPKPGDKRTHVFLETVDDLHAVHNGKLVLAGCIGPFSLAARLVGVSEAMELTLTEPGLMHAVLEKSTDFLISYINALRANGADGVIMAEPAAGLLSPKGLSSFSSHYIRQIAEAIENERFAIILHNCAAKLLHLPAILETGLKSFHFGAPMDIVAALEILPDDVVVCGNLDPTKVFVRSLAGEVSEHTRKLLYDTRHHYNFVISSGCDLPASTPLGNLDAFFETVSKF